MAKILIKHIMVTGCKWLPSGWIKISTLIDKSKLEEKRKEIISIFSAKQCLFIYEEKGQ